MLGRPSKFECVIFITVISLNLLDSLTTLAFTLSGRGFELNPALRVLMGVNPFLVFPFLLSTLLPILLFRFNKVVEYGVATLLITIYLVASLNNIGLLVSRYSLALPVLENMDIQFLAFLAGLTYIGGYSLYQGISYRYSILETLKKTAVDYALYLLAYLVLGLIPLAWLSLFR